MPEMRTVADLRRAVDRWEKSYRKATRADAGRGLEQWQPGVSLPLDQRIEEQVNGVLLNLSFGLLEEQVVPWAPDDERVTGRCWRRVQRYLRLNEYTGGDARYLVTFERPSDPPVTIQCESLQGCARDLRLGDLYDVLAFHRIVVRPTGPRWPAHRVQRLGETLVRGLMENHTLDLDFSVDGRELCIDVTADHDLVDPRDRPLHFVDAVARSLSFAGFECGTPRAIARNAYAVPLRRGRRTKPALVVLPPIPQSQREPDENVLLLTTAPVLSDFGQVVALRLRSSLLDQAASVGLRVTSFDVMLQNHHIQRLEAAVDAMALRAVR